MLQYQILIPNLNLNKAKAEEEARDARKGSEVPRKQVAFVWMKGTVHRA